LYFLITIVIGVVLPSQRFTFASVLQFRAGVISFDDKRSRETVGELFSKVVNRSIARETKDDWSSIVSVLANTVLSLLFPNTHLNNNTIVSFCLLFMQQPNNVLSQPISTKLKDSNVVLGLDVLKGFGGFASVDQTLDYVHVFRLFLINTFLLVLNVNIVVTLLSCALQSR
jgi:hypothetical protein